MFRIRSEKFNVFQCIITILRENMIIKSHHQTNALYRHKIKIMFRYIKKFFGFFNFNFGYDEKLHIKLLLPGMESWNSNGSFKYKNYCGENIS